MISEVYNIDNMEYMRTLPDKFFELAIVDPPYGLGKRTTDGGSSRNSQTKFMDDIRRTNWDDNTPTAKYWEQLFRVSKNQIIWGGNYFGLPAHRCFIVWDKMTYVPTMSQVEQAWTSFDTPARLIKINSNNENRIHPTEKPVKLYKWVLENYATCKHCKNQGGFYEDVVGDGGSKMWVECEECEIAENGNIKIFDSHMGSQSSRIAAYDMGFDYYGCELDKDYFEQGNKRFELFKSQGKLFK